MPENITLNKIIWIIFLFFLTVTILSLFFITATGNLNFQMLYVTIFIGILLLKELTDEFIPDNLKKKLNLFISGLILVFLLIVINEILHIISK